jgi:Fur family transcriptional regulator, ferric uptake regulator
MLIVPDPDKLMQSMKMKRPRRMTKQRRLVREELSKMFSHPTADELHQRIRQRLSRISMATVYRNLEILCEEGLAKKMDTSGQRRFDGNTTNHYHIRCCECGRVEDVDFEPMATLEAAIQKRSKYKVLSHGVEFLGVCPGCLATNRDAVGA